MSKEKIIFIAGMIVLIISSTISVSAAILYNGSDVIYSNSSSGLSASNVQNAIDELYSSANNYDSLSDRVTAMENKAVVEIGTTNVTTNIWEYKKYEDGTLDMWTFGNTSSAVTPTTSWNMRLYTLAFSFPSTVKPYDANYIISGTYRVSSGFSVSGGYQDASVNGFTVKVYGSASGAQTVIYNIYIHGRWK